MLRSAQRADHLPQWLGRQRSAIGVLRERGQMNHGDHPDSHMTGTPNRARRNDIVSAGTFGGRTMNALA